MHYYRNDLKRQKSLKFWVFELRKSWFKVASDSNQNNSKEDH